MTEYNHLKDPARQDFCVYIHFRRSDGKPFYVGKGRPKRPYWFYGRSVWWNRIKNKHGCRVFVAAHDLQEREAFTLERALISRIGPENLCNHTDGGEGCSNPSPETRKKMSLAKIGRPKSPEAIRKHAEKLRGRKMPKDAIEKTRMAHIGMKRSPEARARMSASHGDAKIYKFIHKDGEEFVGLRREMGKKNNLSYSETYGLVCGKRKTAKGWRLANGTA